MQKHTTDMMDTIRNHPGVVLDTDGVGAWLIMSALQLLTSHPQTGGHLKERATLLGRGIQKAFEDDPRLMALAEAGWHRDHDIDWAATPEETEAAVNAILAEAEAQTYICSQCGGTFPAPPMRVWRGTGPKDPDMVEATYCPGCFAEVFNIVN